MTSKEKMQAFIQQVINELQMTEEDIRIFSKPKALYKNYTRRLIYDMDKYQLNLFQNVATFPAHIKTVNQRHKVLIMFIEKNRKFIDDNYISIWFRMAHECYLTGKKVSIQEFPFEKASRVSNDQYPVMSFNIKNNIPQEQTNIEYIEDIEDIEEVSGAIVPYDDTEEDENDEILQLCYSMKALTI